MSDWDETLALTCNVLERLCLSAAMGTPWYPPRIAGGGGWGEGGIGASAQTAAPRKDDQEKWWKMLHECIFKK